MTASSPALTVFCLFAREQAPREGGAGRRRGGGGQKTLIACQLKYSYMKRFNLFCLLHVASVLFITI